MAANSSTQRATLKDLPTDFSLAFLKVVTLSLKSRQNGIKFADESYYNDVKMFINDEKTIFCTARCFASYKTHDEPRHVSFVVWFLTTHQPLWVISVRRY